MIPSPWEFALLALAAFRAARLIAWDTFPPIERVRSWILGGVELHRNGDESFIIYGRPLLGDLLECPYCVGWWVSLGLYLGWLAAPTATLVLSVPLALGAVVGLVARTLDP